MYIFLADPVFKIQFLPHRKLIFHQLVETSGKGKGCLLLKFYDTYQNILWKNAEFFYTLNVMAYEAGPSFIQSRIPSIKANFKES